MSLANNTTPIPSPCVGLCSTTYGDLICLGCKRSAEEVRLWPSASPDTRHDIWLRLSRLIVPVMKQHFVVDDEALLRSRLQQLQVRHYHEMPALHLAWILLRKKFTQVEQESLAAFGIAWQTGIAPVTLTAAWDGILKRLHTASHA